MTTQEAYDQAVKELCAASHRKDFATVQWIACAIEIMWDRLKQEATANEMGAFYGHQVVKFVNMSHHTRRAIQDMKDRPEDFGGLFKSEIGATK
jgi:hypothetical protein